MITFTDFKVVRFTFAGAPRTFLGKFVDTSDDAKLCGKCNNIVLRKYIVNNVKPPARKKRYGLCVQLHDVEQK